MVTYNVGSLLLHAPTSDNVLNSTNAWNNKTLRIEADNDIAIHVIGSIPSVTSSSYTVFPTNAFSTHFVVASYNPNSGFL